MSSMTYFSKCKFGTLKNYISANMIFGGKGMTKTVGIDASTKKTGMCLLTDGKLTDYILLDYSYIDDTEMRIKEMSKDILKQLNTYDPDLIFIEDSWSAMNVQVTKLLTRIMGVTYAWAISKDRYWESVLPAKWRKNCGIENSKKKRAELKKESMEYVKNRYGIEVNDDVSDAISLADGMVNYYNAMSKF